MALIFLPGYAIKTVEQAISVAELGDFSKFLSQISISRCNLVDTCDFCLYQMASERSMWIKIGECTLFIVSLKAKFVSLTRKTNPRSSTIFVKTSSFSFCLSWNIFCLLFKRTSLLWAYLLQASRGFLLSWVQKILTACTTIHSFLLLVLNMDHSST